jgi:hypothetical protein
VFSRFLALSCRRFICCTSSLLRECGSGLKTGGQSIHTFHSAKRGDAVVSYRSNIVPEEGAFGPTNLACPGMAGAMGKWCQIQECHVGSLLLNPLAHAADVACAAPIDIVLSRPGEDAIASLFRDLLQPSRPRGGFVLAPSASRSLTLHLRPFRSEPHHRLPYDCRVATGTGCSQVGLFGRLLECRLPYAALPAAAAIHHFSNFAIAHTFPYGPLQPFDVHAHDPVLNDTLRSL